VKLFFRQGIVRCATTLEGPTFLQRTSSPDDSFVDLSISGSPVVITFAHKNANYVFEEAKTVRKAWGPFSGTTTRYLFWDVNVLTGELTRGSTTLQPVHSGVSPLNPANDQHWFDMLSTTMKVWTTSGGGRWVEKIRVFAGTYYSGSNIEAEGVRSQAGINGQYEGGNLILDSFSVPLRQSDGSFVTTVNNLSVVSVATKKVKFETEVLNLMALNNIPKFTCVQTRPGRRMTSALSTDRMSRVAGIALEDVYEGEVSTVVSAGLIRSDTFTWPSTSVNRPLFCGPSGELTLTPPTQGVLQQVGFVYDTDAVYVDIKHSITLDHPDTINLPPPPPPPTYPVADFTVVPFILSGQAPFVVNFQDLSTNSPTAWEWDFTNDGVVDSTAQNPSYTYVTPGTYNVRLKATNGFGWTEKVQTSYITVTAAAQDPGNTNLEVRFEINGIADTDVLSVKRSELFQVKLKVKNDGLATATNVQRVFIVHDAQGNQVVPSNLPPGAVVTRVGNQYTKITFVPIASMISGGQVDVVFSLLAPPTSKPIIIEAAVTSPEVDSTTSDNTRSLTIQVKA